VTPSIAVAAELRARGHEPIFIGVRHGAEARMVPAAGFPLEWIDIGGLQRVGWNRLIRSLGKLPEAIAQSSAILAKLRPAAIFSMGGYVAGPVLLAAIPKRIPIVAMEPNATPGLVHRRLARFLHRILVALPEAANHFPRDRTVLTGVPVRPGFASSPLPPLDSGSGLCVLLTGGSQGARTLNRAFRESWPWFRASRVKVTFLHQAGHAEAASLAEDFACSELDGAVTAFVDDMPAAYAAAHLIVCRAGGNTIAELSATGRPAILVPFPHAADDHQTANARSLAVAGAAMLVPDAEMTGERLFREVTQLASNPARLGAMARAAQTLARPDAAVRAADELERAGGIKQNHHSMVDTGAQSRNN
jgi:UDP-N-acetylglucosamine--N-acetylmuramyl-(pentapeptide) pyrophosphoryl-undecaprenol N-acetylglucosamine transferase